MQRVRSTSLAVKLPSPASGCRLNNLMNQSFVGKCGWVDDCFTMAVPAGVSGRGVYRTSWLRRCCSLSSIWTCLRMAVLSRGILALFLAMQRSMKFFSCLDVNKVQPVLACTPSGCRTLLMASRLQPALHHTTPPNMYMYKRVREVVNKAAGQPLHERPPRAMQARTQGAGGKLKWGATTPNTDIWRRRGRRAS